MCKIIRQLRFDEVMKVSIIDTFDFKGEEIIKAKNNVRMIENFPKTVLP